MERSDLHTVRMFCRPVSYTWPAKCENFRSPAQIAALWTGPSRGQDLVLPDLSEAGN